MPARLATMRYAIYLPLESGGNWEVDNREIVPWGEFLRFFIITLKIRKNRDANTKRHIAIAMGGAKSTAMSTTMNEDPQMTITPTKPKKYTFDPPFEDGGVDAISDMS